MSQKVYVLINEAMPHLVKIGMTDQLLEQRIMQLSSATGVPLPFEVFYAAEVHDMKKVESLLHVIFADKRLNPKREFFTVSPHQVVAAIQLAESVKDITPQADIVASKEEQEALNVARKKAERFNFSMIGIPTGTILTYKDDETITCTVADTTKVEFEGTIQSLFSATMIVLKRKGYIRKSVQGGLFWTIDGETLVERRMRYELGE